MTLSVLPPSLAPNERIGLFNLALSRFSRTQGAPPSSLKAHGGVSNWDLTGDGLSEREVNRVVRSLGRKGLVVFEGDFNQGGWIRFTPLGFATYQRLTQLSVLPRYGNLTTDTRLRLLVRENPKRQGSAAAQRFAGLLKAAQLSGVTLLGEAVAHGYGRRDLRQDVEHALVEVMVRPEQGNGRTALGV